MMSMCMLPQSYWPACLGSGFVIDEDMERVLDTMEVTALVEAVCSSSSLWGLGVFTALPTNQSLLWGIPHLSFHTCHYTLVTLPVMVSFLFMPWQEVRRVSFGRCFSRWLPGEQWSFCVSVCSSPPTARSLSSWKLDFCMLSCALRYISRELPKKCVLHIRPRSARPGDSWLPENSLLNWERCLYSWCREVLQLDRG